mgnify:CR=1 FL=1
MTPQQLMDLPYAGMAEKKLRKSGRWVLTPHEKLDILIGRVVDAADDISDAAYDIEKTWSEIE